MLWEVEEWGLAERELDLRVVVQWQLKIKVFDRHSRDLHCAEGCRTKVLAWYATPWTGNTGVGCQFGWQSSLLAHDNPPKE